MESLICKEDLLLASLVALERKLKLYVYVLLLVLVSNYLMPDHIYSDRVNKILSDTLKLSTQHRFTFRRNLAYINSKYKLLAVRLDFEQQLGY